MLKLRNAANAKDFRPMDPTCSCMVCQRYSRAYLHNVVTKGIPSAAILVSYHNVAYMQSLTRSMRSALQVRACMSRRGGAGGRGAGGGRKGGGYLAMSCLPIRGHGMCPHVVGKDEGVHEGLTRTAEAHSVCCRPLARVRVRGFRGAERAGRRIPREGCAPSHPFPYAPLRLLALLLLGCCWCCARRRSSDSPSGCGAT